MDLLFAGSAGAGEAFLDAGGGEVEDGDGLLGGGEEENAAGVAHEDGGAGVAVVGVEFFDGHLVGAVFLEQFGDVVVELLETLGERQVGVGAEDTGVDHGGVGTLIGDDGIAAGAEAGVYA